MDKNKAEPKRNRMDFSHFAQKSRFNVEEKKEEANYVDAKE